MDYQDEGEVGGGQGRASAEVGSRVCTESHCLQTPFCSKRD